MWTPMASRAGTPGCRTSWLTLFLAAHVINSWFSPSHSQMLGPIMDIEVIVTPKYPTVGEDVTLSTKASIRGIRNCIWFRGEEETYVEIIIYLRLPVPQISYAAGYDGRQELDENCSLSIHNISFDDQALYGIKRNSSTTMEIGEAFIRVLDPIPELEPQQKALTSGLVVVIIAACLIGSIFIGALCTYQAAGTHEAVEELTWTMFLTSEFQQDTPLQRELPQGIKMEQVKPGPSGTQAGPARKSAQRLVVQKS
ncbi:hypothetical protein JRQ81_011508 [Phrynocephalus forsythii]|uniref:Uncharacterized protein n=1 Tax=Phrynocephalus forsythii TaxID=171643 RepID=A0A9Q0X604_9SAUR|nr:hypothetical protein JRQ81_011508 [Phrynocephalus forsythii]